VIKLPFCHLRAGLIFKPKFLPLLWAVLHSLVPVPHQVPLCIWNPYPNSPGEWVAPSDQTVCWCLSGSLLLVVWRMQPGGKGGEKYCLCDHRSEPSKCYWKFKQRHRTLKQCNNKQYFTVPAQLSRFMSKGWAPTTKGSQLLYTCKQVTEAKSKVWLIRVYLQFYRLLHPSATWLSIPTAICLSSRFDSLSFISLLCHPFLSATLHEHRLACFLSGPLPCYNLEERLNFSLFFFQDGHYGKCCWVLGAGQGY
jgi:hypothetical protein